MVVPAVVAARSDYCTTHDEEPLAPAEERHAHAISGKRGKRAGNRHIPCAGPNTICYRWIILGGQCEYVLPSYVERRADCAVVPVKIMVHGSRVKVGTNKPRSIAKCVGTTGNTLDV
jgi:hypothetical protein